MTNLLDLPLDQFRGYLAEGTVQPVANPSQLGYFANASAPVGLLAAQPSTEDELRQYLMQRGLLQ